MSRGGKRSGAGGQFKFNGLPTKPVRIPVKFEKQIIEYAQQLANQADDNERFTAAYRDHGRGYVPIHWLRNRLNLPADRFDSILDQLSASGQIILQPGDPSSLTPEQIEKSYQDETGNLRIAVTWSKDQ
jgi:hypothetical protein